MRRVKALAGRALVVAGMLAGLAACESGARQDPLPIIGSSDDIVFADVPVYTDRTVDESIVGSLELTDYALCLYRTGLLTVLQRNGPFTVFAPPNTPLEQQQQAAGGQLLAPTDAPFLQRLLAYTIVPGAYSEQRLRTMIAHQHGPVALRTLNGRDVLTLSIEPATGQLLLGDARGHINRIWLSNVPQSNGVLYVTQSLLTPDIQLASSAGASIAAGAPLTYVPGDYTTGVGARH
ncbi:fasciclin domain-containing protein [Lichenicoccus sp.]|uniref:fasciclin domain-containing protein n=1 Tax=Lichenicoccus sp. TaxID=2781899 RepID=UPI003D0FC27A